MATAVPDVVPGTIHLIETLHHTTHNHDIVLNPRPSTDPEDPLNWKPWRKQLNIWMVYTYIFGVAIATAVQYSVLTNISEETGISVADLNTGTGLMFLFLGWGCLIWQPIALVFGRRGVYILSSLLAIGPMVWTAYSHSAGEWWAHRILIGIIVAPAESLPEVSVPDLFFAHDRGTYIGLYALFVFGGNALAPFFAGFITDALGWESAIWFGTIVLAVTTVIIFFGLEETMYFRETIEGVDEGDAIPDNKLVRDPSAQPEEMDEKAPKLVQGQVASSTARVAHIYPHPRTYVQKLALFRNVPGRPSVKQMFIMMYRPLLIFFHFPCVDWAGFLYGVSLSWYNVCNATMSLILSGAPYYFSPTSVGLAFLSLFVGAVLGAVWAGYAGDKAALYLARRNGGVREPEHRLWVLMVSGIIGAVGFILWGVGAANGIHFMGLIFGVGMVEFGVVAGASTSLAYDIDCFKEIAGETLILVIVIRNTMGFGMSYGITPWIAAQGLTKTFVAVAMLSLVTTLTFLVFIVYGKALRKWSARKYWEYVSTLVVKVEH
jgi:MFS family permease